MKKLLIATTALVGTASVAAADVTFNGYGRFGILYEEDRTVSIENDDGTTTTNPGNEVRLESRYRLNIDSSTETDAGIRFAARIRLQGDDIDDNTTTAADPSAARLQVNAGGLRVRVGNVSGVYDAAETINTFGFEPGLIGQVGHYSTFGGSGRLDAFSSSGTGTDGFNVKYEYDAFTVMASYSENHDDNAPKNITNNRNGNTANGGSTGDFETFEIGASYEFSGWTIGGAWGNSDNTDTVKGSGAFDSDYWVLTATGAIAAADVAFFVGDTTISGDDTAYGISGSYPVGAATNILASYAGGGSDSVDDAYGIGFDHSLGGGVSLKGMVGVNNKDNTVADFGVIFNF